MSTAETRDDLTRRMAQLVALGPDADADADGAAFSALVGALRAEIGAVRVEVGAVRSQTTAVRSELEGLGSRLTGAAAATRGETGELVRQVAELAARLEGVGGRLDEVRDGLPRLGSDLREQMGQLPGTSDRRLEQVSASLVDVLGTRVDDLAGSVHRRLTAAQDREDRAAVASQAALVDARISLEARLESLEASLGAMSERVEGLSRSGTSATGERLEALSTRLDGLGARIDEQRRADADIAGRPAEDTDARSCAVLDAVRELAGRLEQRDQQQRDELAEGLRQLAEQAAQDRQAAARETAGLRELRSGVETDLQRALSGLAGSVFAALAEAQERSGEQLAAIRHRFLDVAQRGQAESAGRDEAAAGRSAVLEQHLQHGLEQLRGQLGEVLVALQDDISSQLAGLAPRVAELTAVGGAQADAVRELRHGLGASVDELRDRLLTAGAGSQEQVRTALLEHRADATASARALYEQVVESAADEHRSLAERLGELETLVAGASALSRAGNDRLGQTVAGLATLVGAVDQARAELTAASVELADAVSEKHGAIRAHLNTLGGQADGAGAAAREAQGRLESLTLAVSADAERARQQGERLHELMLGTATAVSERLAELVREVGRGGGATEAAVRELTGLTASARELDATVAAFRTEWPTRTYEVVEGARAVADAVVRDVRAQVQTQLDAVQDELGLVAGSVDEAGEQLRDGTDRMARAGEVLVAYLERRDRLLEVERGRSLHEVLDDFAAGLAARERTALAERVTQAVVRRRDARDAERYRASTPEVRTPTAELPAELRRLVPGPPDPAGDDGDSRAPDAAVDSNGEPGADDPEAPDPDDSKPGSGGRAGPADAPRVRQRRAAGARRARLAAVPAVPRADRALEAAAPADDQGSSRDG